MKQLINTDAIWRAINTLYGAEIAELIAKVGEAIDEAEQEAFDDGFDKGWESREALIEVEEDDDAYYEGDSGDETEVVEAPDYMPDAEGNCQCFKCQEARGEDDSGDETDFDTCPCELCNALHEAGKQNQYLR